MGSPSATPIAASAPCNRARPPTGADSLDLSRRWGNPNQASLPWLQFKFTSNFAAASTGALSPHLLRRGEEQDASTVRPALRVRSSPADVLGSAVAHPAR